MQKNTQNDTNEMLFSRSIKGVVIVLVVLALGSIGLGISVLFSDTVALDGRSRDEFEKKLIAAMRTVKLLGLTEFSIETTRYDTQQHGCDHGDYAFPVIATRADERVSFVICCGQGRKGCTIQVH